LGGKPRIPQARGVMPTGCISRDALVKRGQPWGKKTAYDRARPASLVLLVEVASQRIAECPYHPARQGPRSIKNVDRGFPPRLCPDGRACPCFRKGCKNVGGNCRQKNSGVCTAIPRPRSWPRRKN